MFEKKLMIAGLRKQQDLIGELIGHLEERAKLDPSDGRLYDNKTTLVARNLRKLRKIKKSYFDYLIAGNSMQ